MKKYIIQDWAGNRLNYKGKFERPQFCVELEFDTFEDGWEYVYLNIPKDCHCDIYVLPIERGK